VADHECGERCSRLVAALGRGANLSLGFSRIWMAIDEKGRLYLTKG
jgi:hypothetical protein